MGLKDDRTAPNGRYHSGDRDHFGARIRAFPGCPVFLGRRLSMKPETSSTGNLLAHAIALKTGLKSERVMTVELSCRLVDDRRRDLGQQRVSLLFLLQGLVEQFGGVFHAELIGPRNQRAVSRNLIVLNGLTIRQ